MTPEVPKIQEFMQDSCPMAMPAARPVPSPDGRLPGHLCTRASKARTLHLNSFSLSAAGQPGQNAPGVCTVLPYVLPMASRLLERR